MMDLARVALFTDLSDDERERIAARLVERSVPTGRVILQRGTEGRALFVVRSGAARVDVPGGAAVQLGPGDVFGELSLLSGAPVSASVTATAATDLSVLPRGAFLELLDELPELREAATRLLIERLRRRESSQASAEREHVRIELPTTAPKDCEAALETLIRFYRPDTHFSSQAGTGLSVEFVRGVAAADGEPSVNGNVEPDVLVTPSSASHPAGGPPTLRVRWANEAPPERGGLWALPASAEEVEHVLAHSEWSLAHVAGARSLDSIARWVTRRWVGVALGAGGALGLAHFGVLAALEAGGVRIDTVSGSSMGGIAALFRGVARDADEALELARRHIGSNSIARRPVWFPRASFLSDGPVRREALNAAGERGFAQLSMPVNVVATDLAHGVRVDLDRGSAVEAMLATSAVPGAFPPVPWGEHRLVDGGLVSRLPVDLLHRSRCGLCIAVNVVAPPESANTLDDGLARFLGFRSVLGAAWDFLGWWQGVGDAEGADVLIEPDTRGRSGYDFDEFDALVQAGREAAESALPSALNHARTLGIL